MKRRYLNSQEKKFWMMMASVELFIKEKTHLQESYCIEKKKKTSSKKSWKRWLKNVAG